MNICALSLNYPTNQWTRLTVPSLSLSEVASLGSSLDQKGRWCERGCQNKKNHYLIKSQRGGGRMRHCRSCYSIHPHIFLSPYYFYQASFLVCKIKKAPSESMRVKVKPNDGDRTGIIWPPETHFVGEITFCSIVVLFFLTCPNLLILCIMLPSRCTLQF